VLQRALELSGAKWWPGFSDEDGIRQKVIAAGDLKALEQEVTKAKERFKLPVECRVVSVYEAGRDGFWIHRAWGGDGDRDSGGGLGEHRGQS